MLQPSEDIKARLDIVDVIRDYIPLKAAGVNFRARCPFHNEKTPSLMISPEKQIWHCFGCGKGGDIFAFVMELEGLDFGGALRLLAPKAGVVLTRQDPKLVSEKNRVLDVLDWSRKYFHKVLLDSPAAKQARAYLEKRGLNEEAIEDWQIGYSPDSWDLTLKFLRSKGFTEKEIFLAGMSSQGINRPGYYDRFRGRIMFPIDDANANVVAFTARVSPEKEATEKMGKYINSPQTMVYDKSKILFGFDKSKQEIKRKDAVIIVEGQMDAIAAHQFDYKNVVAASGTALTTEQVNLVKRLTNNIYLAFDMDRAGELAADRGIREALAAEMNIKIIELPAGKDPDECIRNDQADWQQAITQAKQMMQYYFDKTFAKLDIKKVEDKQKSAKILLPLIVKLGSKLEQDFWLKQLGEKLDTSESVLRETIAPMMKKAVRDYTSAEEKKPVTPVVKRASREERLSDLFLALLLKFMPLLEYAQKHIRPEHLTNEENKELYKNLVFYYNNINNNDLISNSDNQTGLTYYQNLRDWLAVGGSQEGFVVAIEQLLANLDKVAILGDEEFYNFDFGQAKNQLMNINTELERQYLSKRMKELGRLITEADKDADKDQAQALMQEFKIISDELKEVNQNFT
jgi:DNA primase